ncbi:MAG TPA: hypothetical protein VEI54_09760 [Candidatus Limnocylindrales bacterium]|nr:hypothetical protein [Candidatus Limnocylindrales bacterium]
MYCPECKAEYRQGFTRCADCDVDLVWELPKSEVVARHTDEWGHEVEIVTGEPGDPNKDPFCSFWKGEDPRVHAELCSVLDAAGVPHHTVFRRDHLFNLRNYPAYEVGVPFSFFERAENAVKEAYGTDEVEEVGAGELKGLLANWVDGPQAIAEGPSRAGKLPETMTPPPDEEIPGPPSAGEGADWFPEDATASVWSTESGEPGDFLVAALHENGIRCRLDKNGQREELFVLPEDETAAREIVKEVNEGEPPEE